MRIKLSVFLLLIGCFIIPQLNAKEINYKTLYGETSPAVVLVLGSDDKYVSKGTGSIIDRSGLVLTNTHVVMKGQAVWKRLFIYLKPQKITGNLRKDLKKGFVGKVLSVKPEYDLALVQIVNPPHNLSVLPLSDLSNVGIGEPTVAIGHPGGGAPWTLTTGKISASWGDYKNISGWDVFQTETSLNPGNSGGPLIDGSGAIIGINTFIVRKGNEGLALTGLNFAVKTTVARKWIKSTLGKLPPASSIQINKKVSIPKIETVLNAPPPAVTKKVPAGSSTRTILVPKKPSEKGRSANLVPPKRRSKNEFTTRVKTGLSFSGSKLEQLFKKADEAFDELDLETSDF